MSELTVDVRIASCELIVTRISSLEADSNKRFFVATERKRRIVVGRIVRRSAAERSVHIEIDVVHAARGGGIVLSKEPAAAVAALW